jgi:hypothetical protein
MPGTGQAKRIAISTIPRTKHAPSMAAAMIIPIEIGMPSCPISASYTINARIMATINA